MNTSSSEEQASAMTSPEAGHSTVEPKGPSRTFATLSLCAVLVFSALDLFIPPLGIPITLILIAILLRRSQEPWSHLGLRRPRRWWPLILGCLVGGVALQAMTLYVTLPVLDHFGFPLPDFSSFAALEGNAAMLAIYLLVSWTTAGFGEEVIWRGFLMTRVLAIFGEGPLGWSLALLLSSVGFGLLHAYQGVTGILLTGSAGLIFGLLFLLSKRQLWCCILLHAFTDTVAMLMLYTGAWRGLLGVE